MKVIFDLDGTLALNDHRQHFVERPVGEKDWRGFFAACDEDAPNDPIIRILQLLWATGNEVEIWSGRSSEVKEKTKIWLERYGLGVVPLRMRPEGDHTADHDLKRAWYDDETIKPQMVFDDRASVVAMWRSLGVVCCQVAPGEF